MPSYERSPTGTEDRQCSWEGAGASCGGGPAAGEVDCGCCPVDGGLSLSLLFLADRAAHVVDSSSLRCHGWCVGGQKEGGGGAREGEEGEQWNFLSYLNYLHYLNY